MCNYTNGINSSHLLEIIDLINSCEWETNNLYEIAILYLFDFWVSVENDTIVILYTSVFLVSHLDSTISEQVNMIFLEHFIILVCLVFEEGSLDLSSLAINKFNIEDRSFTLSVLPRLLSMLLSDSSLNFPIKEESI
jgi:hypothetical protein